MKEVINTKIEETKKYISHVTELLYQKREQEAYTEIEKLILGLMELNELLIEAFHQGEKFLFEEEKFKNALVEAMEAMEQKDMILFADIMQYEISEQLQTCVTD